MGCVVVSSGRCLSISLVLFFFFFLFLTIRRLNQTIVQSFNFVKGNEERNVIKDEIVDPVGRTHSMQVKENS